VHTTDTEERACAICAAHAPLRNAYAILGTIHARVCKGRCSVASSKAAVNENGWSHLTSRLRLGNVTWLPHRYIRTKANKYSEYA